MSFGHMFFTEKPCHFLLKSRYFKFERTVSVCDLYTCFRFDESTGWVDRTGFCLDSKNDHYFLTRDGTLFIGEVRRKYPEGIYAYVMLTHRQGEDDFANSKASMLKNKNRLPLLDFEGSAAIRLNQPYRLCDDRTVHKMQREKRETEPTKKAEKKSSKCNSNRRSKSKYW